jgi:hypothetical protein
VPYLDDEPANRPWRRLPDEHAGSGGPGDPPVDEGPTIAETLPRAYRQVLDALARLEALGVRREAAQLRSQAIRAYSKSWDEKCHEQLALILAQAELLTAERLGTPPPSP